MPQRKSPLCLRTLSIQAIGNLIHNTCYNMVDKDSRSENDAVVCFQNMYSSLPFQVVDEVFNTIFTTLNKLANEMDDSVYGAILSTVNSIIRIICDRRVRELIFEKEDHPSVKDKMVKRLPHMPGLTYLDLDLTKPYQTENILTRVSEFKNLIEFHHWECTNEIVKVIAHNCKQIQVIDVSSSGLVTDMCLFKLLECKTLKYLNVNGTCVSGDGCAAVLKSITGLRRITYWKFTKVLKELKECYPMNVEIIEGLINVTELTSMEHLFPSLKKLCVNMIECDNDSNSIPLFPELRCLDIYHGHFYSSPIHELLDTNGRHLHSLLLFAIEGLNENAILHIAEYCPNLNKLEIKKCNKLEYPPLSRDKSSKIRFKNLNVLKIMDSPINIECILSRCPNIVSLEITFVPNVTGNLIVQIFDKYRMSLLKNFTLSCMTFVSAAFIYRLLQCIENLESLNCAANLSHEESRLLLSYISTNNLNVSVKTDL